MGRSFEGARQDVEVISARWRKAARAMKNEDQV
jgi:hypothetical protein